MNESKIILLTVSLLAILNPIGNAMIFLSLTTNDSLQSKHAIVYRSMIAVLIILLLSTWLGLWLLHAFGISIAAFEIAGALIVLRIGLDMLQAKENTSDHHTYIDQRIAQKNKLKQDISIVPLAIPIVAGPGTISTVILNSQQDINHKLWMSGIIIICVFIVGLIFHTAPLVARWLGASGARVVTRLMGLVLSAIAIQMLLTGLLKVFPAWGG